jgi:hypothetical protein
MDKDNKLTREQIAGLPGFIDKWIGIYSSSSPAGKLPVEEGIKQAYQIASWVRVRLWQ